MISIVIGSISLFAGLTVIVGVTVLIYDITIGIKE